MSQPLLIILIIAGYFLLLLGVSHVAARGADNSTFFGANRKIPWPVVALAMICAPISGVTFISVPGMVMSKGYAYMQMCLGFTVGYFLIAWVLLPIFYRNKVASIYSYLEERFCNSAYKSGAWMFLISKTLGTAVRFFVICAALQLLVFGPLHIPFEVTVIFTMALIFLYTVNGGVKAVVWTDMIKCIVLITSICASIWLITDTLGMGWEEAVAAVRSHPTANWFNFSDPRADTYFWKQFIAGIFLVVSMTGLDQDMMQHALSCRDATTSKKNMVISGVMQLGVISLFLFLGTLLVIYAESRGVAAPDKSDDLFATVAFDGGMPLAVGILFVLGLVSATYSAIGSALTSLTTSFTLDIAEAHKKNDGASLGRKRRLIHAGIAAVLTCVIIAFYHLSRQDAISAVYTLASYTYGPILGMFAFGLLSKRRVDSRLVPAVCIGSPVLSWLAQWGLSRYVGYETGFELLLMNALLTVIGLYVLSLSSKPAPYPDEASA